MWQFDAEGNLLRRINDLSFCMSVEDFVRNTLLLAIVFNSLVAVVVLHKYPRRPVAQAFAAMMVCIVLWLVGNFVTSYVVLSQALASLISQADYAAAACGLAAMWYFVTVFPDGKHNIKRMVPLMILSLITVFLCFSGGVVAAVVIHGNLSYGQLYYVFGSLYQLYYGYALCMMIGSLATIIYRWVEAPDQRTRIQFQYLALGLGSTLLLSSFTNLLLPEQSFQSSLQYYVYSPLQNIGPASTIFLTAIIAYAIVRHSLLDIKVLVRRNQVYYLSAFVSVVVVFFVVLAVSRDFETRFGFSHDMVLLMALTFAFVIFFALRGVLENVVRKVFKPQVVDLSRWTPEETARLHRAMDVVAEVRDMASDIQKHLVLESVTFLVYDHPARAFRCMYPADKKETVAVDAAWVEACDARPEIILRGELDVFQCTPEQRKDLAKMFTHCGGEMLIPLKPYTTRQIGFIVLSRRIDAKPFTAANLKYCKRIQTEFGETLWNMLQYHFAIYSGLDKQRGGGVYE